MDSITKPVPTIIRKKAGYQRNNGRWEGRYRPSCKFELIEDEVTKPAFKGYANGKYKYEFLEYFDTVEEKNIWMKTMKEGFAQRKQESDPSNPSNKKKNDSSIILSNPKKGHDNQISNSASVVATLPPSSNDNSRGVQEQRPQIPSLYNTSVTKAKVVWYCTVCNQCFDHVREHAEMHKKRQASTVSAPTPRPSSLHKKGDKPLPSYNNENDANKQNTKKKKKNIYITNSANHVNNTLKTSTRSTATMGRTPKIKNNNCNSTSSNFRDEKKELSRTTKTSTLSEVEINLTSDNIVDDIEGDELLDGLFNWVDHEVTFLNEWVQ